MLMETTRTPGSDICMHWWIEIDDDVPGRESFVCEMCGAEQWVYPTPRG